MRSASDLRPGVLQTRDGIELPISRVADELTASEGPQLELMTRTTPIMVKACQIGYIYSECLGSKYVRGRIDQVMRLAVSMGGEGRKDMIESLRAGGRLPDSIYSDAGGHAEFSFIPENAEDES